MSASHFETCQALFKMLATTVRLPDEWQGNASLSRERVSESGATWLKAQPSIFRLKFEPNVRRLKLGQLDLKTCCLLSSSVLTFRMKAETSSSKKLLSWVTFKRIVFIIIITLMMIGCSIGDHHQGCQKKKKCQKLTSQWARCGNETLPLVKLQYTIAIAITITKLNSDTSVVALLPSWSRTQKALRTLTVTSTQLHLDSNVFFVNI